VFERINEKVKELESQLVDMRRHLHQYPELSGHEVKTSNYVNNKSLAAGLESEIISTEAGPAVVAYIRADSANATVALRADMDALPVDDKKDVPYASKNQGVMHACGHDFHTTSVFGAALVLEGLKKELDINVKFIFQPAEEGSKSGAEALVKAGIMNDVDAILTVHAMPTLPAGKVGVRYGAITSAVDYFRIKVKGVGGHSSRPDKAVDSIFAASRIINALYADIPREFSPTLPIVIAVGKIQGGTAPNVISENCVIEGTVRTTDISVREKLHALIREKASNVARHYGANVEVEFESGSPPVINDSLLAKLVESTATSVIGEENVVNILKPSMGAEDFARYLDHTPGILIRIGTGGIKRADHALHSCLFDIDEKAIPVAVSVLSSTVFNLSKNKEYLQPRIKNTSA